jgi:hypothetical protein
VGEGREGRREGGKEGRREGGREGGRGGGREGVEASLAVPEKLNASSIHRPPSESKVYGKHKKEPAEGGREGEEEGEEEEAEVEGEEEEEAATQQLIEFLAARSQTFLQVRVLPPSLSLSLLPSLGTRYGRQKIASNQRT